MISIFVVSIIALVAVMIVMWKVCDDGDNIFAGMISVLAGIAVFVMAIVIVCFAFEWYGAEQKAGIINREYGTNYTQKEVFYASEVIDTIREIDRSRVELNGNLLKGENNGK